MKAKLRGSLLEVISTRHFVFIISCTTAAGISVWVRVFIFFNLFIFLCERPVCWKLSGGAPL